MSASPQASNSSQSLSGHPEIQVKISITTDVETDADHCDAYGEAPVFGFVVYAGNKRVYPRTSVPASPCGSIGITEELHEERPRAYQEWDGAFRPPCPRPPVTFDETDMWCQTRDSSPSARKRPKLWIDPLVLSLPLVVRRRHSYCNSAHTDDSPSSPASYCSTKSAASLCAAIPRKPSIWFQRRWLA
ncbi:hypothetical protein DAEQUDRAFT_769528 [Daedalea quercina L-15889]|uniref:Uncharacterized protein n=1 Tax=Daedalea quercina L-15889 TaxID=1314783 RepID=A0A165LP17_9APHY|nr:hypothetical protein DAEQUDRAFT_769528 [Daedalea quercina L-15889]